MQILRLALLAVMLPLSVFASAEGEVGPGIAAPALSVKTWYKGTPVKELKKDQTYVVEFWATWCGPCIESIPHLTEIAKKNKDITFIGVSIWEEDKDGNVDKFIKDMGDKMDYNVGYSGNQDGMAKSWMAAAGQNGIPTAFIVKDGIVQWVGHPMELEKPLEEVKSGKFDLKAFKVGFDKRAAEAREQMAAGKELGAASKLYEAGKKAEAKAALDAVVKKYPSMQGEAEDLRFNWLANDDPSAWTARAEAIGATKKQEDIDRLCMFAIQASSGPKPNTKAAAKAIKIALKASAERNVIVLYYGALVASRTGDFKQSVALADKALAVLPTSELKDNANFKKALDKMRTEASAKVK